MDDLYYEKKVSISNLILDWRNPRLRSRYKKNYDELGFEGKEAILIYTLVSFFNVDELVESILGSEDITTAQLHFDKIVIQENLEFDKFFVKEGNRRVCAFKIINNRNILNDSSAFVEQNDLSDIETKMKFEKNKMKIIKILNRKINIPNRIPEIPCLFFNKTEEADRIIKACLRNIHIKSKKEWESVDKKLFDYDEVIFQLNKGAESIGEAFNRVIDDEAEVIQNLNKKTRLTKLKAEFKASAFYHYIISRINANYLGCQHKELMDKLMGSFLPICSTLVSNLKKISGVEFKYHAENGNLVFLFELNENKPKISDVESYVDEVVKKILISEEKPITHTRFNNENDFKKLFEDIIKKYINIGGQNDSNLKEPTPKGNPGIHLSTDSDEIIRFKINNPIINLKNYINSVYNLDGSKGDINNIVIEVDGKKKEVIDSQVEDNIVKIVLYSYQDNKGNRLTAVIKFKFENEKVEGKSSRRLLNCLVNKNKELFFNELSENLLNEIDLLSLDKNPYVLSTLIRGLFEVPIIHFHNEGILSIGNAKRINMFSSIEQICDLIENKFKTKNDCSDLADYYGIQKEYVKNTLTSSENNFAICYKYFESAAHSKQESFTSNDVENGGKKVMRWLYICNYLINKKRKIIA